MKNPTNDIRQGDVLIVPVQAMPPGCKDITPENGRVVLAYGEVTGHAHAIYDVLDTVTKQNKVRLWSAGVERFLQVLPGATFTREIAPIIVGENGAPFALGEQKISGVALQHEEHTTHAIPPGIYKLPLQVEYTPAELRGVAD